MLPGKGKAKGSAFEREVCKRLSLWVTNGKSEDVFWRSAMSGGRATVGARKGKDLRRQAGDITAVAPEGHSLTERYYIECKHVKQLRIDRFIVTETGPLADFWKVAKREAERHGRIPMIIARQNQMPTLVLLPYMHVPSSYTGRAIAAQAPRWGLYLFEAMLSQPYDDGGRRRSGVLDTSKVAHPITDPADRDDRPTKTRRYR